MSWSFEEVARQYLRRLSGAGVIAPLSEVAFWWFNGGDIDAAGISGRRFSVAGSAKWTNAYMKPGDLEDLRGSIAAADPGADPDLYLFSRSGFDPNLGGDDRVHLVRLADLFAARLEYERRDAPSRPSPRQLRLDLTIGDT